MMMKICNQYIMKGKLANNKLDKYHLIIAPSYACNLRCKHCYLDNHSSLLLSKEKLLEIIDEWVEIVQEESNGTGIFHLKGGEPFILPYFWEILEYLAGKDNLEIFITTNGTFSQEQNFRKIKDMFDDVSRLTFIVSLDGFKPSTDALLRGKIHFYLEKEFILNLRKYGFNFQINYVVHRHNLHELKPFVEWAVEKGVCQVNFIKFIPKGYGAQIRDFEIDDATYNQVIMDLYSGGDERIKQILTGSIPYINNKENYATIRRCVAGFRGLLYITPDGNVYPCPATVFPEILIGNVYTSNLKDLFKKTEQITNQILNKYYRPFGCVGETILKVHSGEKSNVWKLTEENDYEFSENAYCVNRNW